MSEVVTMDDIGRRAGVTKRTVSYVLNSDPNVTISKKTQEKVRKVAKELGYRQNVLARNLRLNKSYTIGVLAPSHLGFYGPILAGIESILKQKGYLSYLLNTNDAEDTERSIELYLQRRIDGMLLLGPTVEMESYIEKLVGIKVPFLVLSWLFENKKIPTVGVDPIKCGELATEHLISLGHKSIVFLAGEGDWNVEKNGRLEGYRQALKRVGVSLDPDLMIENGWGAEDGYVGIKQFLEKKKNFTAIYSFNDLLAYGALRALSEAAIKVPEEVSVVSNDDREFSNYTSPPLTTVKLPEEKIGIEGAKMFMEMLSNKKTFIPRQLLVEPEMIIRQSTGKCMRKDIFKKTGT